jgi:hypothetical protein
MDRQVNLERGVNKGLQDQPVVLEWKVRKAAKASPDKLDSQERLALKARKALLVLRGRRDQEEVEVPLDLQVSRVHKDQLGSQGSVDHLALGVTLVSREVMV